MTSNIDRREALKRTAVLLGGTISAPTLLGVLNGCTPSEKLSWTPEFFTSEQAQLVTSIADTIVPKGETPGAVDVGVPSFIEDIVSKTYSEIQKSSFMDGMSEFMELAEKEHGDDFADLSNSEKEDFVKKMQAEAMKSYMEDDEYVEYYQDTRKVFS